MPTETTVPKPVARPLRWRVPRALPWAALLMLLGVAQTLLVVLTSKYEAGRAQDRAEEVALATAGELRRRVQQAQHELASLPSADPDAAHEATWRDEATKLLKSRRELVRIERRGPDMQPRVALDSPLREPVFARWPRAEMQVLTETACGAARRTAAPAFSASQFIPQGAGGGAEVLDLCVPLFDLGRPAGYIVATVALAEMLQEAQSADQLRRYESSFVYADGSRLARAGALRGTGIYTAERVVDLPGTPLQLRIDASEGRPSLIPNLATALVLGLSMLLFALVWLLARDVQRRARAERALADALAFRKAMEDSLSTGLRARGLDGRIRYVNPAFCAMVGFSAEELQQAATPPYWPPEHAQDYARRQATRFAPDAGPPSREGFETVFMRRDGERFPVMIYEAPLVDGQGGHAGWMSAVLDVSAQRRVEDLSRQQQERLQATARLATVGEMASLLAHELNQPLAAIASYASGSINLLDRPDEHTAATVRPALARIAEQAERAGRVIRSVQDFVRRREHGREAVSPSQLVEAVLPLVRLQARKSGARVEVGPLEGLPQVMVDRTMVEQVLLNLSRNGLQAMEGDETPLARRVLRLEARRADGQTVEFSVADAGPGIAPEVAERLFTPFFTTRREGMGLGLSLCRTVVEQHGGRLAFGPCPGADGEASQGTAFRFTLPSVSHRRATAASP